MAEVTDEHRRMADEMMAEVCAAAYGTLALAEASTGAEIRPHTPEMDAYEAGVSAGFLETMRMLMRRGLLPSTS